MRNLDNYTRVAQLWQFCRNVLKEGVLGVRSSRSSGVQGVRSSGSQNF
ncbi:hypothetical protein [Sphaerospermopsis sp. FACHB-1194]|nr:hypothetical protein [Sphaerospermopsis sp. FACHB-1194]MBD2147592.1 hypothetical protein [Sphaerospermopsis sp. FACHB-1194]